MPGPPARIRAQPAAHWWSIHATIHGALGLTGMKVSEMESRVWGATAIEMQGQGDEEDAVWESCETWTPMAIDHALQAIESAHDASRAAEWSSAYHKDFETRVTDGFDRFHALLGDL
jgi:hypothetical protein